MTVGDTAQPRRYGASKALRWVLALLLAANVVVVAAIFGIVPLALMGWSSTPPPHRVDLARLPLPAITPLPNDVAPSALASEPAAPPKADLSHEDESALAVHVDPNLPTAAEPQLPVPADVSADIEPSNAAPAGEGEAGKEEAGKEEAAPALAAEEEQTLACIVLGPFTNEAVAQAAIERVERAGGAPQLQTEAIAAPPHYLVYVEPAIAKDVAVRNWQALRSQAIDAFVIPSGELENGVSVGLFKVRELAQAQRERVSQLGYSVKMRTVDRSATVYRVVARNVRASALVEEPAAGGSRRREVALDRDTPHRACKEADSRST